VKCTSIGQEAGRGHDLADIGHGHARRRGNVQPHPDRHGKVVADGERKGAAFGCQCVGATGVDDGDGVEQVFDCAAHRRKPLLRKSVARIRSHRLAQRAQ
jgi:hypothetical protein